MPNWLAESVGGLSRQEKLRKAEQNLDELLREKKDKKVKADITKFVAKTLGSEFYKEKSETHLNITAEDALALNLVKRSKPNAND